MEGTLQTDGKVDLEVVLLAALYLCSTNLFPDYHARHKVLAIANVAKSAEWRFYA